MKVYQAINAVQAELAQTGITKESGLIMINPKNSENALKMFQTEFETKHVISEKADMTEVDIKNELTVKGIDYTISSEEYQTLLNLLGVGRGNEDGSR